MLCWRYTVPVLPFALIIHERYSLQVDSFHLTATNPTPSLASIHALRNFCSSTSVHCTLSSSHFFVLYSSTQRSANQPCIDGRK